jgi:hypothetical protein
MSNISFTRGDNNLESIKHKFLGVQKSDASPGASTSGRAAISRGRITSPLLLWLLRLPRALLPSASPSPLILRLPSQAPLLLLCRQVTPSIWPHPPPTTAASRSTGTTTSINMNNPNTAPPPSHRVISRPPPVHPIRVPPSKSKEAGVVRLVTRVTDHAEEFPHQESEVHAIISCEVT